MSSTLILSVPNSFSSENCDQVSFSIFSELPITKSTSPILPKPLGSIWAAQPVTINFAFGFSFRSLRISCFDLRTASAVTAHVLIITASFKPAEVTSSRIASVSYALSLHPSVDNFGVDTIIGYLRTLQKSYR